MNELQTFFLRKLEKMLSVEDQIIKTLPILIASAASDQLRDALSAHLNETQVHYRRLMEIFAAHGYKPIVITDKAFQGMLFESKQEIDSIEDRNLRDAAIIAAAQSVEHFEIAQYGTIVEWAKQLGDTDAEGVLKKTLAEEKAADQKLSDLAEGGFFTTGINEKAAREVTP